jgi:hypothetical protein
MAIKRIYFNKLTRFLFNKFLKIFYSDFGATTQGGGDFGTDISSKN